MPLSEGDPPPDEAPERSEPRPRGRLRRIVLRALVLCGATLVAVAVLEAWATLAHPFGIQYYEETGRYLREAIVLPPDAARPDGRIFENRPGADLRLADFRFATDGEGLRSAHPTLERPPRRAAPPAKERLLFLGDSVTLGWGVDDADTWIRRLEGDARAPDGRPLECLNAGHLQYNTIQEADWLDAHGAALAPDAVVLTFVVNDVQDDHWALYQAFRADVERAQSGAPVPLGQRLVSLWDRWLPGTRELWLFAHERMEVRRTAARGPVDVEQVPGYAEGWARCERGLDRVRARCAELGARLVVLDFTTPRVPAVRAWCEARGVPWHDLDFSPEEWAQDVRNSAADSHANALGNRYIEARAWRGLAADGLVAAPPEEAPATGSGAESR